MKIIHRIKTIIKLYKKIYKEKDLACYHCNGGEKKILLPSQSSTCTNNPMTIKISDNEAFLEIDPSGRNMIYFPNQKEFNATPNIRPNTDKRLRYIEGYGLIVKKGLIPINFCPWCGRKLRNYHE